ncbi:uncharacterized protein [Dermacentor albipictus]|uniref:uncharacterized protein isoform X1 n=1 Tax=Dermacentor albipictus TaxID=60249 RepID=UPI0038FCD6B8
MTEWATRRYPSVPCSPSSTGASNTRAPGSSLYSTMSNLQSTSLQCQIQKISRTTSRNPEGTWDGNARNPQPTLRPQTGADRSPPRCGIALRDLISRNIFMEFALDAGKQMGDFLRGPTTTVTSTFKGIDQEDAKRVISWGEQGWRRGSDAGHDCRCKRHQDGLQLVRHESRGERLNEGFEG